MDQVTEEDGSGPGKVSRYVLRSGFLAPVDTTVLASPCTLCSDDAFQARFEA